MPRQPSIRITQPNHKDNVTTAPGASLDAAGFCLCDDTPAVSVWVDQADGKHKEADTVTVTPTATAGIFDWTAQFNAGTVAGSGAEWHTLVARLASDTVATPNQHQAAVDSILFGYSPEMPPSRGTTQIA